MNKLPPHKSSINPASTTPIFTAPMSTSLATAAPELKDITIADSAVTILWADGVRHEFHPLWLRESSHHPEFRDTGTRLRIQQASELPLDIAVTDARIATATLLKLRFSDGHSCEFASADLYHAAGNLRPRDLSGKRHYWDAASCDYRSFAYADLSQTEPGQREEMLLEALNEVARVGFVKVEGIPLDPDALLNFARLVGPPRETSWGTITDVFNSPQPYDLTMTSRSLSPHVDNPYRLPGPGYIFMHCLKNDAEGGESTLVDGFAAADQLRTNDPESFEVLCRISPNFRHEDESAILEDYGPMIGLNAENQIARIRFSNRTEQIPPLDRPTLERYYRARQQFAQLIFSGSRQLKLKLQPGEGFIWDNYRILHGRTAFDPNSGDRHMRHCYMDRDTVSSRQKCLLRSLQRF